MPSFRRSSSRGGGGLWLEAGLAIPLVVLLALVVLDGTRVFHARSRLQSAVDRASRVAAVAPADDRGRFYRTREDWILEVVKRLSGLHDLDSRSIELVSVDPDASGSRSVDGSSEIWVVRVSYAVDMFTPGLALVFPGASYRFSCSARLDGDDLPV